MRPHQVAHQKRDFEETYFRNMSISSTKSKTTVLEDLLRDARLLLERVADQRWWRWIYRHNFHCSLVLLILIGVLCGILGVFLSVKAYGNANYSILQSQMFNKTVVDQLSSTDKCLSLRGVALQPYYIVLLKTFISQLVITFNNNAVVFLTASESWGFRDLTFKYRYLVMLPYLVYWAYQLACLASSGYSLAFSGIPESWPDVTWFLSHNSPAHYNRAWRVYETIYFNWFSGGAAVYIFSCLLSHYQLRVDFYRYPTFLKSIQALNIRLMSSILILMLPGVLTHTLPVAVLYFPYTSFFVLFFYSGISILRRLKKACAYKPNWGRVVDSILFTFIAFSLTIVFQTFFVWGSLYYETQPSVWDWETYSSIPVVELTMRRTHCYVEPLKELLQQEEHAFINSFNEIGRWLTFVFVL